MRLARRGEGLEEPIPDLRRDSRSGIANPEQHRAASGNRRNVDRPTLRHDFQRIHQQIHENAAHARPVHRDEQAGRDVLHDSYGLKLGADCNPVHGAGDHITKVGDFESSLRVPAAIETLFQQFANSDRSAIHVLRKAVDLWPGKA